MSAFLKFYSKTLQLHPMKTQMLTTGFLMGCSDLIAQTLIEQRNVKQIELPRVVRFAFLGTCFVVLDGKSHVSCPKPQPWLQVLMMFKCIINKCKFLCTLKKNSLWRYIILIIVAPTLRVWYIALERKFGAVGKTVGLKKMLCDQFMFAPLFVGSFLTAVGIVQFQHWHVIKAKVKEDYLTVMKSNYMLWPGAQLITFYLIPLQMRIIFVSFVALLWNTYLAYQANKSY